MATLQVLFFRGSTTGGYCHNHTPWQNMHRQRLAEYGRCGHIRLMFDQLDNGISCEISPRRTCTGGAWRSAEGVCEILSLCEFDIWKLSICAVCSSTACNHAAPQPALTCSCWDLRPVYTLLAETLLKHCCAASPGETQLMAVGGSG